VRRVATRTSISTATCIAAALVFGAVATTAAHAASTAQVQALAARAEHDPAALAQLRRVRVVAGRPENVGALLNTSGPALQTRLATLAAGGTPGTAPSDTKTRAQRILAERRFTGSPVPRPFHGALAWIGRKFSFLGRFEDRLDRFVPGGSPVVWTILAALVVGIAAVAATRMAARREGRLLGLERSERRRKLADPDALEHDAADAEGRGDFELALRLRFRAGLIRLGRADRLPLRDSLTSGEAARVLRLDDFDALARSFDEVVYGRRAPGREDVENARARWTRVLAGTGSR
jgi:hypothetical protein